MGQSRNLLIAVFTFFTLASATASTGPTATASSEIRNILQISFSDMNIEESAKVYVTFMLTEKNEVIVLKTNNTDYDSVIKSSLNYKQLESKNLTKGETFTLPIVVERK